MFNLRQCELFELRVPSLLLSPFIDNAAEFDITAAPWLSIEWLGGQGDGVNHSVIPTLLYVRHSLAMSGMTLRVFYWLTVHVQAREKTGRLYEIFCKQLLSFSSLSTNERHKLEKDVDQLRNRRRSCDADLCVGKVCECRRPVCA